MALLQCGKHACEIALLLKNIEVTKVFMYCSLKWYEQTGDILD